MKAKMYIINADTESGDHYHPYEVLYKKPTEEDLERIAHEVDGDEDREGPGHYGSYAYLTVEEEDLPFKMVDVKVYWTDGWGGVYFNDKLQFEGDSVSRELVESLDYFFKKNGPFMISSFESRYFDYDEDHPFVKKLDEVGKCPKKL